MHNYVTRLVFLLGLSTLVMPATAIAQVPLRATIATTPVPTGACGQTCVVLSITGSGHATLMGAIEIAGPSQVDVASGEQTGTSTLTAANGDSIVIEFAGAVQVTGPSPADPVSFSGTFEVIDGTGRFAGASGSGTYSGHAAGPAGTLLLDGEISRPGRR